jgi:hypothetical protein
MNWHAIFPSSCKLHKASIADLKFKSNLDAIASAVNGYSFCNKFRTLCFIGTGLDFLFSISSLSSLDLLLCCGLIKE